MTSNGLSNIASSARSKEYFNEIKNLIFKGARNIRINKFLISHIRSLAGTMNILNADTTVSLSDETTQVLNNTTDLNESIHISDDNECLIENSPDSSQILSHTPPHTHNAYEENVTLIKPIQTNILNEIETWRGYKNKELKRGKYLRVCPDVESMYKKPQVTSRISIFTKR